MKRKLSPKKRLTRLAAKILSFNLFNKMNTSFDRFVDRLAIRLESRFVHWT